MGNVKLVWFLQVCPALILYAGLYLCFFLYGSAFTAHFQFDDYPNLEGLSRIHDLRSAAIFVLGGASGPLGRPLSLLTYLPQAHSWPSSPEDFFYVNACIHLINTLLMVWVTNLMLMATDGFNQMIRRSFWEWFAVSTGLLWAINPLLLSTAFSAIQRMTLLSASCMLGTMVIYLKLRVEYQVNETAKFPRMNLTLYLLAGGILGVLFKETAVNLIIYVALIECLLLKRKTDSREVKAYRTLVLYLPILVMFVYLLGMWFLTNDQVGIRDFTLTERVLSAPGILSSYVRQAVSPRITLLGFFHDDWPVSQGWNAPETTILHIALWTCAGLGLYGVRHKWPIVSLSGFWFLGGHFLEAGPVGLELYFEHRNYLPLFGVIMLIMTLPFLLSGRVSKFAVVIPVFFAMLSVTSLSQAARLLGKPAEASEVWYSAHPNSLRAAQFRLLVLLEAGERGRAIQVLEESLDRLPASVSLPLQSIQVKCELNASDTRFEWEIKRFRGVAQAGSFEYSTLETFGKLIDLYRRGQCKAIESIEIDDMLRKLFENPRYMSSKMAVSTIHLRLAQWYLALRDFDLTMREWDASLDANPDVEVLATSAALFLDAGLPDEAIRHINDYKLKLPRTISNKLTWQQKIAPIEQAAVIQLGARSKTHD